MATEEIQGTTADGSIAKTDVIAAGDPYNPDA